MGSVSLNRTTKDERFSDLEQVSEERLLWDVLSLSVDLMRLSELWGKRIGVSGSQWIILMAIRQLGHGPGVPVKEVAAFLNADASFVTTQSKILEKLDLVERIQSMQDRRSVLMSLTAKANEQLASLAPSMARLQDFVRTELGDDEVCILSEAILRLRNRLDKAVLLVASGA